VLLLLVWPANLPRKIRQAIIQLSLEEGAEHAGLRVSVEVDDTCVLIFGQSTRDFGLAVHASHNALI